MPCLKGWVHWQKRRCRLAKAVLVCFRDRAVAQARSSVMTAAFRTIDARLGDDRVASRLKITTEYGVISACFGHVDTVSMRGASIALGQTERKDKFWSVPGNAVGDGTYALFRAADGAVELATDALATRTIWYYQDDDWLIASTSQRALIMLLGSFIANHDAVPWMLANGVAGPVGGWDKRLRRVPPDSRLLLDRATWQVRIISETASQQNLDMPPLSDAAWRQLFETAVRTSVERLDIVSSQWRLPLSGGYDSRLLATMLAESRRIHAVTWGRQQDAHHTEMSVAAELAGRLQLPHEFITLVPSADGVAVILDRFLAMSEGLTDSVAAYLDGFRFWCDFVNTDVQGIIRGDEPFGGFGWSPVHSQRDVRLGLGLAFLSDRPSTAWLASLPGMAQELPATLEQETGEPLETWRHRLYRNYRVPVALAALTETKTAYVEVLNPLQSRRAVEVVRALPNRLRRDKRLLIDLTHRLAPSLPFASLREGDVLTDFLHEPRTVSFLRNALDTADARALLPAAAIDGLLARLPVDHSGKRSRRGLIDQVKRYMPRWIKRRLKRVVPDVAMDPCLLAFRAWVIVRIQVLMAQDAAVLASTTMQADCRS